jgi:cell division protein YceG involved in septum cleavage
MRKKKWESKKKEVEKKEVEKKEVEQHNINNAKTLDIDIDNYVIPDNYNYRTKYKIKNIVKKMIKESEINHLEARKQIIDYLKNNNQLNNDIKIDNVSFKFNNLDKFISAYAFEK